MTTRTDNLAKTLRDLDALGARAPEPLRALERDLSRWMMRRQVERFASADASEDGQWPQASPDYLRVKAAILSGDVRPLRWGGRPSERLYPSLTVEGHPEQILRLDADGSLEFGSRVPWADDLARGGVDPFGAPFGAHDLVGLGPRTRARLVRILRTYLLDGERDEELQR